MKQPNLSLALTVPRTSPQTVEAIRDVRAWWGAGIEGRADAIGDTFRYRHGDLHDSTQRLIELVPGERIVWLVTEAHLSFTKDPGEWRGTRVRFDVAQSARGTEVRFTHEGLTPQCECFEMCSKGWGFYVGESLRGLLTSGRGKPDAA